VVLVVVVVVAVVIAVPVVLVGLLLVLLSNRFFVDSTRINPPVDSHDTTWFHVIPSGKHVVSCESTRESRGFM
jgi:hypothetical protein